jgi:hypothetical protein
MPVTVLALASTYSLLLSMGENSNSCVHSSLPEFMIFLFPARYFPFATVSCKDLPFCLQKNSLVPLFSLLILSSAVQNVYRSCGCFTLVSVFKKLKVDRSLGTRAIIEALKSCDNDLLKVLDGKFLELSSQSEQNFSDCSK